MKQVDTDFLTSRTFKPLLAANVVLAIIYFFVLGFYFPRGNVYLFYILMTGEIFHLWQLTTFTYTVWNLGRTPKKLPDSGYTPTVDVLITVAGEPADIVKATVTAAKNMDYPKFNVFVLNDGYVAGQENWRDTEILAKNLGVKCITRKKAGGAKAGNVNNGVRSTSGELVAVLDADHVPHQDFLNKTVPYLEDRKVGFVQTPQYYKNHEASYVAGGAWEQQQLFFGPIMKGKNRDNAAFMCGTNMVIRREALVNAGGFAENNIAEDFLTSLFIHEAGWRSIYLPEVLSEGLAPEDFGSYYKQQYRWARGSLEIVTRFNPFLRRGTKFKQKIHYLSSATFYLSGWVTVANAAFPLIFFFTGLEPFRISTMTLAAVFLPYIFLTLYNLQLASNATYTYRAFSFSMSSFMIHIRATLGALFRTKAKFNITAKKKQSGNFMKLTIAHFVFISVAIVGAIIALVQHGPTPSVITNISWAAIYVSIFAPFIRAAMPDKKEVSVAETAIKAAAK